jgi:hypothetical protein
MKKEEASRIIAEFMDARIENVVSWASKNKYQRVVTHGGSYRALYTDSLDALVPVWEKCIDQKHPPIHKTSNKLMLGFFASRVMLHAQCIQYMHGFSFKQSAAIATAKAILELESEVA